MFESPRYYWLKLSNEFFNDIRIRILRKTAGDTAVMIYFKMLLKAISTGGSIEFLGLEENFYEELAIDFNESEEACKITVEALEKYGLLETEDGKTFFFASGFLMHRKREYCG